ncbi:MAG: hypothetical protein SOX83_08090 [Sodaliphilus sp.]|nr:hypothetical protein [Sodaliphilus sp.]
MDSSVGYHETGTPNYSALYPNTPNYADELSTMTGSFSQQTQRRREINQDFMLSYEKDFNKDFHFNGLVGFNGNERRYSSHYAAITNLTIPTWYNISNSAGVPSVNQSTWMGRLSGVYEHLYGS